MIVRLSSLKVILFCGLVPLLFVSCSEDEKMINDAQVRREKRKQEQKEKQQREELAIQLEKEKQIELAKLAEEEAKAKLLKENLLLAEQEAKQKIAEEEEEERVRQEAILKRQHQQQLACQNYVNTEYDELVLIDGKVLKAAQVSAAGPVKVSFIHSNGVSRVRYSNLPKEIGEACLYNLELEQLELERIEAVEKARIEKLATSVNQSRTQISKREKGESIFKRTPSRKTKVNKTPKVAIRSSGGVSSKVVRTYRKYYSPHGREYHFKDLVIMAKANTKAYLYFNGRKVKTLEPNKLTRFEGTSKIKGKYTVTLKDEKGKVLDSESDSRKSGL